jgi:hypothetical protein
MNRYAVKIYAVELEDNTITFEHATIDQANSSLTAIGRSIRTMLLGLPPDLKSIVLAEVLRSEQIVTTDGSIKSLQVEPCSADLFEWTDTSVFLTKL